MQLNVIPKTHIRHSALQEHLLHSDPYRSVESQRFDSRQDVWIQQAYPSWSNTQTIKEKNRTVRYIDYSKKENASTPPPVFFVSGAKNTLTVHLLSGNLIITKKKKKMGCLVYDTKLHLVVRFKFWWFGGVQSTLSLLVLPGPLWLEVEVAVRVISMCRIDLIKK